MLTTAFLFIFYTVIFSGIFLHLTRSRRIALSGQEGVLFFLLKLITGCAYGYFFMKFYNGDDTWKMHHYALEEYQVLVNDPNKFVVSFFTHDYTTEQATQFFTPGKSYWRNLPDNILIRLLSVCDLFSRGNYYVNVIFFSYLSFWAHYFLFCLFQKYIRVNRNVLLFFCFAFPPLLFWESGIRKDALMFLGLTGCCWFLYKYALRKQTSYLLWAIGFIMLCFLVRNFVAIILLGAIFLYGLLKVCKKKRFLIFIAFTIASLVFFFLTSFLSEGFNLPLQVAERQHAFLQLKGGSYLETSVLDVSWKTYVRHFPNALNHVFIRPYLSEIKNPLFLMAFAENLFLLLLLVRSIYNRSFKILFSDPFCLAVVFFILMNYLLVGLIVPFLGAIVRYRVCFEIGLILICIRNSSIQIIKNNIY